MADPGSMLAAEFKRINFNRRGHIIADLTALSFLIDKGFATVDQVAERLQEVQKTLPEPFRDGAVSERTKFLVDVLAAVYGSEKPAVASLARTAWTPQVIEGGRDPDRTTDPIPPEKQ